jgi:hypothetical protein
MRRLHQAFQLIGRNHGHIAPHTPAHDENLAVIHRTVHERFELLTRLAVAGFGGHMLPLELDRIIVQKMVNCNHQLAAALSPLPRLSPAAAQFWQPAQRC